MRHSNWATDTFYSFSNNGTQCWKSWWTQHLDCLQFNPLQQSPLPYDVIACFDICRLTLLQHTHSRRSPSFHRYWQSNYCCSITAITYPWLSSYLVSRRTSYRLSDTLHAILNLINTITCTHTSLWSLLSFSFVCVPNNHISTQVALPFCPLHSYRMTHSTQSSSTLVAIRRDECFFPISGHSISLS